MCSVPLFKDTPKPQHIWHLQVQDVRLVDDDSSTKYSSEVLLYVDKYEIV